MPDRLGLEPEDRRNFLVVIAIMSVVLIAVADGPPLTRVIVGLIGGILSGIVFLVVTAILNVYKPDYW